jgi:hypothetical protein
MALAVVLRACCPISHGPNLSALRYNLFRTLSAKALDIAHRSNITVTMLLMIGSLDLQKIEVQRLTA